MYLPYSSDLLFVDFHKVHGVVMYDSEKHGGKYGNLGIGDFWKRWCLKGNFGIWRRKVST